MHDIHIYIYIYVYIYIYIYIYIYGAALALRPFCREDTSERTLFSSAGLLVPLPAMGASEMHGVARDAPADMA